MIIFKGCKLDDSVKFDEEINITWKCSNIKNVFCCNLMGNNPSVKNLRNDLFEFYTFVDMWTSDLVIDMSNATVVSNGLNIVEDFMKTTAQHLIDTDQYEPFLYRCDEIKMYLYSRFSNNWNINLANLYKISNNYDRSLKSNTICSKMLEQMIISVPERLNSIDKNIIIELPFIVGDYIYVLYTVQYLGYIKQYKININLV